MKAIERTCRCGVVFTPTKPHQLYHSVACAHEGEIERQRNRRRSSKPALTPRSCAKCGESFTPKRTDQVNCRDGCRGRASGTATDSTSVAARLLADGFYLGDLADELETIGKTRGIVAALEAELVHTIEADPLWPVGRPGRIALLLALLKGPALATMRWRHPHEKQRRPGQPRVVTALGYRVGRR